MLPYEALTLEQRAVIVEAALQPNPYGEIPSTPAHLMINKFGRLPAAAVDDDIWHPGGTYTGQPEESERVTVASDDANDTAAGTGGRTVRIGGLGPNWRLQIEDLTMAGVTPVTSTLRWRRVHTAYVLTAGSAGTNTGEITIQHETTTANVFAAVPPGGRSTTACYTIPDGYRGIFRRLFATIRRGTSGAYDRDAALTLRARPPGGAWQAIQPVGVATAAVLNFTSVGGFVFAPRTDLTVRLLDVSAGGTDVACGFDLLLVAFP